MAVKHANRLKKKMKIGGVFHALCPMRSKTNVRGPSSRNSLLLLSFFNPQQHPQRYHKNIVALDVIFTKVDEQLT